MLNTLAYFNAEVALIVLAAILVLFGGKKIPELMRGVGQGVGELKRGLEDSKHQLIQAAHVDETKPVEPAKTETTVTHS